MSEKQLTIEFQIEEDKYLLPKGTGTFEYVAGLTFRTEAKLQWGKSEKNLG